MNLVKLLETTGLAIIDLSSEFLHTVENIFNPSTAPVTSEELDRTINFWSTTGLQPGKVYPMEKPKLRIVYLAENRRWRRKSRMPIDGRGSIISLWNGCCVCRAKSRGNMPFWQPIYSIRARLFNVRDSVESSTEYYKYFPYKPFNSRAYTGYLKGEHKWPVFDFGVCSKECLNMFYLTMMDAPLEGV